MAVVSVTNLFESYDEFESFRRIFWSVILDPGGVFLIECRVPVENSEEDGPWFGLQIDAIKKVPDRTSVRSTQAGPHEQRPIRIQTDAEEAEAVAGLYAHLGLEVPI